jgi:predicted N-acetyltransferase YhbS
VARGFVLDVRDAEQADDVAALGLAPLAVDTLMTDVGRAARLAEAALGLVRQLS